MPIKGLLGLTSLERPELRIPSPGSQEISVLPLFHQASRLEDQDVVRIDDGGQPMGNDQSGSSARNLSNLCLNGAFGLGVQ